MTESNFTCINDLAFAYCEALRFWNEDVNKCVSVKKMGGENFGIKDMDLEKKGFLSVEDFVCFINLFSGNFYRNRDVIMIFKRFMRLQRKFEKMEGVEYATFMSKVSSDL